MAMPEGFASILMLTAGKASPEHWLLTLLQFQILLPKKSVSLYGKPICDF